MLLSPTGSSSVGRRAAGGRHHSRVVSMWDKAADVRLQLGRFSNQAEYVVRGSKGGMPHDRRAPVLPGAVRTPVLKADKRHLTGKPTALMRQLIRICGGVSIRSPAVERP